MEFRFKDSRVTGLRARGFRVKRNLGLKGF